MGTHSPPTRIRDSADGNGTDNTETRTHNQANELLSQDLTSAGAPNLDLTFDKAGNLRTQEVGAEATPTVVTYTHDLWNRLVKVQYTPNGGSIATRAEYDYNALNWRIAKRADTNPAVSTALDQKRLMYYSANWQMLEERIDDDYLNSAGVNRRFQYVWGPRYIDDIVLRRLDGNAGGDFGDSGTDFVYYHCTDAQFSTVAILNDAGVLLERVSYDPYGRARHHKPADCAIGEGGCDVSDQNLVIGTWGAVTAAGDVTRDGQVNVSDLMAVIGQWGAGLAFGQLSTTDNVIGWDGYVFNSEIDEDGMYTVRWRNYRPAVGRWLERDPAADASQPLRPYNYVDARPLRFVDYDGLVAMIPPETEPISSPVDPLNVPARGCGITLRETEEGYGHWWIEIPMPDGSSTQVGFWPEGAKCGNDSCGAFGGRGQWWSPFADPNDSNADCTCVRDRDQNQGANPAVITPVRLWPEHEEWDIEGDFDQRPGVGAPVRVRGPFRYRHILPFGIGRGTLVADATCDMIRDCLFRYVPDHGYFYGINDCRTGALRALHRCGLTPTWLN